MKYEDIEKANQQIRTLEIERTDKKTGKKTKKEYAEVNQRIKAFRMLYPQGFIKTELIKDEDGICMFKAIVGYTMHITDCDDVGNIKTLTDKEYILGTGYAREEQDSSYINNTSYIENCETSAVGRALGMCGFGIDTAVASYEEIKQVEQQELKRNLDLLVQIRKLMAQKKLTPDVVYNEFKKKSDEMSEEELQEVIVWLENK